MNFGRYVSSVKTIVAQVLHDRGHGMGLDGVVLPGTYDPSEGVVDVVDLESLAQVDDGDSAAQPMVWRRIQLLTPANGFQSGPRGGERVLVVRGASGDRAILEHGTDDSPGALAGESHLVHRQAYKKLGTPGPIDAYIRHTNDANQGDGKAATRVLAGALLSVLTTAGNGLTVDDNANTLTLKLGPLVILFKGASKTIEIGMDGLSSSDAIVTESYLQAAVNGVLASAQTGLATLAASVQGGPGVPPPRLAGVTAQGSSVSESEE